MKPYKLKYKPLGSIAVLIEWPSEIDKKILKDILFLKEEIQINMVEFILDLVPAYNSLTVFFDTSKIKYSSVVKKIKDIAKKKSKKPSHFESKLWKIPVCYEQEFGFDLRAMAKEKKTSVKDIVSMHTSVIYDVYFMGLLPGFIYLGGLPQKLYFNPKPNSIAKVVNGAIGLADNKMGIYPKAYHSDWHIIGNTPLHFFDPQKDPPCFIKAGDKLQFYAIDKKKYNLIKKEVEKGVYLIENERYGI